MCERYLNTHSFSDFQSTTSLLFLNDPPFQWDEKRVWIMINIAYYNTHKPYST